MSAASGAGAGSQPFGVGAGKSPRPAPGLSSRHNCRAGESELCYPMLVREQNFEVVRRAMLNRPVDERRYAGLVRPDKTVRWAVEELAQIETRRKGRARGATPRSLTALPESLRRLADLLTELGWYDLAALARREELMVYRELDAPRPGAFADRMTETMSALRKNLVDDERYAEALAVIDEQLAADRHRAGQVAAREARTWRTILLARLERHEEAVESAAAQVAEIRGRHERAGGAPVDLELCHALTKYAEQLDRVGRVAEAADVTAEVLPFWRGRNDSRYEFARTVDELSDRLARSGRAEEAYAVIADAWSRLRRDHGGLADVWHNLGVRLRTLGHPEKALAASEQAVKRHRGYVHNAREQHRAVEARDDWDDDHRYSVDHLWRRHRQRVEKEQEKVRRAERDLRHALLSLAACLRQVNRAADAAAADAEAATLEEAPDARPPSPA
ncbi:hypothetical protein O7626_10790 [Micromonospora sp. WMMD1102]|uniref:hypothetical protein n=1 Tax=Micromonospora sp. WMMD1102 TaxID=3016105 RepID=UPI0024156962|nr:hypothetical protein [Micromonospora sp. WMMD1102]MDG4786409.1 hypothetical protein [Micromonospora sp. WMMD1102]